MSKVNEYRNSITLHLTRISSDIEHIKDKVDDNNRHLSKLNGRVRQNEKDISRIKGVGGTVSALVLALLSWFRFGDFK